MSLEQEADDWFTRMRGADAENVRVQFDAWYTVPEHAEAYDRRIRSFDTVMFLASTATVRDRNLDIAKPWWLRAAAWKHAAAAIGLMLIGATVLALKHHGPKAADVVSRMEVASMEEAPRRVSLPDGSSAILDRGARMQISFDGRERRLRLLAGRARFAVAHEKVRPFIVDTGEARVIAHGTLFDVEVMPAGARVALLQGAVEVTASRGSGSRRHLQLAAGHQTEIANGSVGAPSRIGVAESQWPNDMLVLDGVEIGDAIAAFNRTAPAPVVDDVQSPRSMKVTGAFRRSDSRSFAQQLSVTFGLDVEKRVDGSFAVVERSREKNR